MLDSNIFSSIILWIYVVSKHIIPWLDPEEGQKVRTLKIQVAKSFLWTPLEKLLGPFGQISSRGRIVRPSVKYIEN